MRHRLLRLAAVAALAAALVPGTALASDVERVIVTLVDDGRAVPEVVDELAARYDLEVTSVWEDALRGFAAGGAPASIEALRADPAVATVEPDAMVTTQLDDPGTAPTIEPRVDASLEAVPLEATTGEAAGGPVVTAAEGASDGTGTPVLLLAGGAVVLAIAGIALRRRRAA